MADIGKRAAGYDIFVSLHQNAFNKKAQGHEVFYHKQAPDTDAKLAQAINSELDDIFDDSIIPNRGTKKANFSVLTNASEGVPAVLVESLFMDAPGMSHANVEKAATAIGRGIEKFFTGKVTGSTPSSNPATPQPTLSSTSGVVNSKVGSFTLNLRSDSFVGANIISRLGKGTSLKILKSVTGRTYNSGTGSRNDWYQIEVNGKTGYVAAYYVDLKSSSNPKPISFNIKPGTNNLNFRRGQEWITSTGYKFKFQTDGNLVLYSPQGRVIWATGTENTNANLFTVQKDGNVVLYNRGKPVWATDTEGNPGASFAIQGDGNLVVYSSNGKALFATGTDSGRTKTRSASSDWLNKGQAFTSKPGYVNSSAGLNFRNSPYLSGSRVSKLANGTYLTILEKVSGGSYNGRNDWYKVKVGNTTGYVAAAYVKERNKTIGSGGSYYSNIEDSINQYFSSISGWSNKSLKEKWDRIGGDSSQYGRYSRFPSTRELKKAMPPDVLSVYEDLSKTVVGNANPVTAGYAYDHGYHSYYGTAHSGIDIDTSRGNVIRSATKGRVVSVNDLKSGYWIAIDELKDNNERTGRRWWYGHLNGSYVKVGQKVTPAQNIGPAGDETGPKHHLHLVAIDTYQLVPKLSEIYNGRGGTYQQNVSQVLSRTMSPLQAYWNSRNGIKE